MERLIFLHIGKTGGTSFRAILRKDDSDFRYLQFNSSTSGMNNDELFKQCMNSRVIIIHGSSTSFRSKFSDEKWSQLLLNSIRLVVVRNPLDKFESDFRYAHQVKSGLQIFSVPHFEIDVYTQSSKDMNTIFNYFTPPSSKRLSINDVVSINWESSFDTIEDSYSLDPDDQNIYHCPYSSTILSSKYAGIVKSPYFHIEVDRQIDNNLSFIFNFNSIYTEIVNHLGIDFLLAPRSRSHDIILTTELLNHSLACMIVDSRPLREFTNWYLPEGIEEQDYELVLQMLNRKVSNRTDSKITENNEYSLTPKNRFKFFQLARKAYTVWMSSLKVCSDEISDIFN